MPHHVYILKSDTTDKYYCGETQDINDRLERHNAGGSKYTKSGIPWQLIKTVEYFDRGEARVLERKIKKNKESKGG